jgi:hypothetical protein
MRDLIITYYEKRFGEDISSAFVHLVREIGEIALGIEKENSEHVKLKITEAAALLEFLSSKYGFDLDGNMQYLYSKKNDILRKIDHK